MRRQTDGRRMNGQEKAFAQAFSRIFSERASFEFREDEVEALRQQFKLGLPSKPQGAPQNSQEQEETDLWKEKHPCLLTSLPRFFNQAKNKRLTVFMDYDGTLAPIVNDPDCAYMSSQMREAVKAVARLFPTAIISGRGREKVEAFVKLKELFYAGSHGMDIVGPKGADGKEAMSYQAAAKFAPVMDSVFAELVERTKHIQGSSVEHNKFCVSAHFRNCEPDKLEEVVGAVEAVLAEHKELHATRGRKVLEIRPQVEWNKGHALAHLLEALGLQESPDLMPIYIGDDRTDEDAFAVLKQHEHGTGILVSTKVKPTDAIFRVRDPDEVMKFLHQLVAWGSSDENGWHNAQPCSGWTLDPDPVLNPTPADWIHTREAEAGCSTNSFSNGDESSKRTAGKPPMYSHTPRSSLSQQQDGEPQSVSQTYSDQDLLHSSKSSRRSSEELLKEVTGKQKSGPESPFVGIPSWTETLTSTAAGKPGSSPPNEKPSPT